MKSESGSLPHNNVKVNGCHRSTCLMFRFTDQFECKPDIIVNRKCPFLSHLPGYLVHVIASLTLVALLRCSLFLCLIWWLLFLLGIQTSTSVLSWSSLLPAFKWMLRMNRRCWAVPQWESDTMRGQKKKTMRVPQAGLFCSWKSEGQLLDSHTSSLIVFVGLIRKWNLSHR